MSQTPCLHQDPCLSLRSQGVSCFLQKLLKVFHSCSYPWCPCSLTLKNIKDPQRALALVVCNTCFIGEFGTSSQEAVSKDIWTKLPTINPPSFCRMGHQMVPSHPTYSQGLCPCLSMALSLRVLFLEALFVFLPRILRANRFLGDMLFYLEISKQVCKLDAIVAIILALFIGMLFVILVMYSQNTKNFLLLTCR